MRYITGIHALNIPCELDTCGDWHVSGLNWKKITEKESKDSIFGDYGIENNKYISHLDISYNVANTLRAILDLMYGNDLLILSGFREDFICNDKYTIELFDKVLMMRDRPNWKQIDKLMEKEYLMKWVDYKEKQSVKWLENRT